MYTSVNNCDACVYFFGWPVFVLLSPPFETVTPEDFDRQFNSNVLASDHSSFVTGIDLPVDDGLGQV
ncbi:hypothetical protein PFWH6_2955 [Pseudomonas fluorescens WH6]|nr:hypothetical protein PFWH6_2955 [Pseudomonas fluorescens WH6]